MAGFAILRLTGLLDPVTPEVLGFMPLDSF
jgi:hypothetical protein